MSEPTIVLACGSSKSTVTCPALELYLGPLFLDARQWALSVAPRARIFVLSALHGFVPADVPIAPYDHQLRRVHPCMPGAAWRSSCRRCLAGRLVEQLHRREPRDPDGAGPELELAQLRTGPVYFVGGANYWAALVLASCPVIWLSACLPAGRATRGIGAQRAWLRSNHGRLPR